MKADPVRTRPLVYDQLLSDLETHFSVVTGVALNLYELLSLLCDAVPAAEIWPEVERYVHHLTEMSSIPPDGPAGLWGMPALDTPGQALVDLLLLQLVHPVTELRNSASNTRLSSTRCP
jgi:hypothetical protein